MAPKRHRGDLSQALPPFDNTHFVNADVKEYFNNVLVGKTFVLERGLRPSATQDGEMYAMIMERNWYEFKKQPHPVMISIVKEFYTNVKQAQDWVVQVRGWPVSYICQTINVMFNLPNIQEDNLDWLYSRRYE